MSYGYQNGYSYYASKYDYYGYAPLYGFSDSLTDPSTGYTHIHSIYADASGSYYHSSYEDRGPLFDRSVQTTQTNRAGICTTDILTTSTPLDGEYHSYGTRYTSTYDVGTQTIQPIMFTFQKDTPFQVSSLTTMRQARRSPLTTFAGFM